MHAQTIELRNLIRAALPEGSVVTAHNEDGHFYKVVATGHVYPSVTGKLQILKEEGITEWKMNRVLDYVFANYDKFTGETIMEHIRLAQQVPIDMFEDAGDIGTAIHDSREAYFTEWINTGVRPENPIRFIVEVAREDMRAVSAMRALEKFCIEYEYEPVVTEQYVYSHRMQLGGALDDLGTIKKVLHPGSPECKHEMMEFERYKKLRNHCFACGYETTRIFCLLDIKTSNQFKDHYFYQVALYFDMFRKLTKLTPEMSFILKLSKVDGTYKIEDLKRPKKLAQYANHVLKVNDGREFIKSLRKNNQKKVATLDF
jgi:hypothetical protein